ncbi:acyl-CoA dehydrogenase family protein [Mycobacterium sp. EPa45]|uniref:acyl-CoA dehydrogenase family protein n=1 Tax=Mycobacterium sp. EPa45 TaxID=1545728 RepID=UPI0006427878|nr:acyl-CoA dehydrogenase family protein [Mycobacterium sp. EPa45]AKK29521.1 acyl-CoA dehydrogenase [Mycobacterium sp. EPa45]
MSADLTASAFTITEEQHEFRSAIRGFLAQHSSEAAIRRAIETDLGYDQATWRAMSDQLKLPGLLIPEEYGGEGFGFGELALVLEEMGAALFTGPYFSSAVLATSVLLDCATETAKSRYLPRIASGHTIATLALTERSGRWDVPSIETRAVGKSGSWTLHGAKFFVPDGASADLVLVVAQTETGIGLFAVDDTTSLSRRTQSGLDPTRRTAVIEFDGTLAARLDDGETEQNLSRGLASAAAGLACEQVGGAQRSLDLAVDYAKVRHQFGRPIGSFQAIRHECANLMLEIECARGAAQYAASAVDVFPDRLLTAAAIAKAYCSDTYLRAAAANIQLHGGIGFTWEHPAHFYYKRAQSSAMLLGDADYHRNLLADRIGL